MVTEDVLNIQGLTKSEVIQARQQYGFNTVEVKEENRLLHTLKDLLKEPMVILLLAASSIYFLSGNISDAVFLAVSILLVAAISIYQENRSKTALAKLQSYTQPHCKVIRDGITQQIQTKELVIGDYLIVEEGSSVPADGHIVYSNDFSVNESVLTGESLPVYKSAEDDAVVYQGTIVLSGMCVIVVSAIGNQTRLMQIGKAVDEIKTEKTPLEIQIGNFVKKMVVAGSAVFIIVWILNFLNSHNIVDSLLKALTLAMSILPEEIPVAFTTFMALGALRLMRMGIIVKEMKTVETLGSATVICTDKTGTITENRMTLAGIYTLTSNKVFALDALSEPAKQVLRNAMWASEPAPFDPMEKALHEAYANNFSPDERPQFKMIHEYPLGGNPPMMTHIFEDAAKNRIIAVKGAPEAIVKHALVSPEDSKKIYDAIAEFSSKGYRVLGVGTSDFAGYDFPVNQEDFHFNFSGLVAFYDPPKKNIKDVFNAFYRAGIKVKIVTGDNAATTASIAKETGFRGYDKTITGNELVNMDAPGLNKNIEDINIFARMYPDAKLKIINALKANHEIVAMTGDGVNDGPALKAAHIGIAMGRRGTEIAKQAASLILADDDLSKMTDAVAMGRRIYANLKKAIQYIISIHIPIILTVFIPLALGWKYPNIFSPVHIIFLELIMGPTCSIIYENEPAEKNIMLQKPRPFTTTFFNWNELITSVVQGLMITAGVLLVYQYAVYKALDENSTRTMVFVALISANIFQTLVNRSFFYAVWSTLRYKNMLIPLIISISIILTACMIYIPPVAGLFKFRPVSITNLAISVLTAFVFVMWYEIIKWIKRKTFSAASPDLLKPLL